MVPVLFTKYAYPHIEYCIARFRVSQKESFMSHSPTFLSSASALLLSRRSGFFLRTASFLISHGYGGTNDI